MVRIKILFTVALVSLCSVAFSQQKDSTKVRLNHYTFMVGAGWTHYYNNLENGDENIKNNSLGASFKFFWEPEHRLSLGLQTGYYKLFQVTNQVGQDTSVQIDRSLIPFLLLVRMRIIDNVYLGAGVGISVMTNTAAGVNQEISTNMTSLANLEVAGSYLYPLSKHWIVGGELKLFYSGSMEDWIYSVQAVCAFKL